MMSYVIMGLIVASQVALCLYLRHCIVRIGRPEEYLVEVKKFVEYLENKRDKEWKEFQLGKQDFNRGLSAMESSNLAHEKLLRVLQHDLAVATAIVLKYGPEKELTYETLNKALSPAIKNADH